MKKILTILTLLSAFLTGCDSDDALNPDSADIFVKYYGGEGRHEGVDAEWVSNGYLLVGNGKTTIGDWEIFVERTDFFGNLLATEINYAIDNIDVKAVDAVVNDQGNLVIAAQMTDEEGYSAITILEFNGGSLSRSLTFPEDAESEGIYNPNSITLLSTGEYIVAGSTTIIDSNKPDSESDESDFFALKINPDLTLVDENEWRRNYGQSGNDYGHKVIETKEGLVFFGSSRLSDDPVNQRGQNFFTFLTQQNGFVTSFFNAYGTELNDVGGDIAPTFDGGFAVLGNTRLNGSSSITSSIPYIVRMNAGNDPGYAGPVLQSDNSEKPEIDANTLIESNSGGYIFSGNWSNSTEQFIYLAHVDTNHRIIWENTFGFQMGNNAYKVIQTPEGAILILGTINLQSQTKMSLIKVNPNGALIP